MLENGRLRTLAVFDKPDPLDGPFFEETIYVTPSRLRARRAAAGRGRRRGRGGVALGLHHGPIHAECRVNSRGVFVLEVAARPIGGLCAKALRFERERGLSIGFEEFLLRHALGEPMDEWTARIARVGGDDDSDSAQRRLSRASTDSRRPATCQHIEEIRITAKPDQQLLSLPEGSSYLGFIFARADAPAFAEHAVREAHARLRFTIDPLLEILNTK